MARVHPVRRIGWTLGAIVLGFGIATSISHASFPGANGRIAAGLTTGCGLQDIATMRPDGTDLRLLTPNVCKRWRTDSDEPQRLAPDWSADGRRLLYLQDDDRSFAGPPTLMAADGSKRRRIRLFRAPPASELSWAGVKPSLAPDGTHFAYARVRECSHGDLDFTSSEIQIWRAALDGSSDHPLRGGTNPRWSPNGNVIAYWRTGPRSMRMTRPPTSIERCSNTSDDGHGNGLWLMNAHTGRDIRRLASGDDDPSGVELDWSPDGRAILYSDDNGSLWTVRADGRGRRLLRVTRSGYKQRAVWSPDGRQIAFVTIKDEPPRRGCEEESPEGDDEGACARWRYLISVVDARGGSATRIYASRMYGAHARVEPPVLSWQPLVAAVCSGGSTWAGHSRARC